MAYTYSKIASVTVGSGGSSSIDFLAIPQNYTDLLIKLSLRGDEAATHDANYVKFNFSSTSFSWRQLYGTGSAAGSNSSGSGNGAFGYMTGSTATANTFASTDIYIPNYAGSSYKSFSIDAVAENNATATGSGLLAMMWSNISPINSITLTPGGGTVFVQYSSATLYGIKAEV